MVYKYLRVLLQERDILAFQRMLQYFLQTELSQEPDFATYFKENYAVVNYGHIVLENTVVSIQICTLRECIEL